MQRHATRLNVIGRVARAPAKPLDHVIRQGGVGNHEVALRITAKLSLANQQRLAICQDDKSIAAIQSDHMFGVEGIKSLPIVLSGISCRRQAIQAKDGTKGKRR